MATFFMNHFFFSIFMTFTFALVLVFRYLNIKKQVNINKVYIRFNFIIILLTISLWLLVQFFKPNLDFILVPYFLSALLSIISTTIFYRMLGQGNFLPFIYFPNLLMILLYGWFEFLVIPKL